jgi:transcriptional regulator with XRE-family HTH domain
VTRSLTGAELRTRRLAACMSRRQLASMVGVDVEVIGEWESEDRQIDCEAAVRQALAGARGRDGERRESARA